MFHSFSLTANREQEVFDFEVLTCVQEITTTSTSTTTLAPITSLTPGASFAPPQALSSSDGCKLRLLNGDLVLTDADGNVNWRAGVTEGVILYNFDGTIAVKNANGKTIWSIQGPSGSTLLIKNCQLVLVSAGTEI